MTACESSNILIEFNYSILSSVAYFCSVVKMNHWDGLAQIQLSVEVTVDPIFCFSQSLYIAGEPVGGENSIMPMVTPFRPSASTG